MIFVGDDTSVKLDCKFSILDYSCFRSRRIRDLMKQDVDIESLLLECDVSVKDN